MPGWIKQIFSRCGAHLLEQFAAYPPAIPRDRVGGLSGQLGIQSSGPMIGLGELRRRLAASDGSQPLNLLVLELGVVRDERQRRPAGRIAGLSLLRARDQQLLLRGGEAHQPGHDRAQCRCAGHASSCWPTTGLRAMNSSDQSTRTMISAKTSVCRRLSSEAGSIGLYVSPTWKSCRSVLGRLSEPISAPPGRRTRNASARILFCKARVGTWWSMVKQPTESNELAG